MNKYTYFSKNVLTKSTLIMMYSNYYSEFSVFLDRVKVPIKDTKLSNPSYSSKN